MPTTQKTANIYNLQGRPTSKTTLPYIFTTPLRPDIIRRAVLATQTNRIQPQGRDPMAGKRTTAESQGTGSGISRVPRLKGGGGRAKFAPSTVGGRQPHPPTTQKRIVKRIPRKEAHLALLSAIAATASKATVKSRGHQITNVPQIPLVVTDEIAELKKTKDFEETLACLGLADDVSRVKASRRIRAGKGKRRGRKMKQAVGPLIVIAEDKGLTEAAANVPGVDVALVSSLSAELLAPGTHAGRLTVWTFGAIEQLNKIYSGGEPSQ
ncbi:MAG TPA: 50S ribosomal protein L4 [Candidatus Bathyarchaeia archaeon]|nr:50S ribosomal protein L4 [Candidatus Bathyarchaeia archaeon]